MSLFIITSTMIHDGSVTFPPEESRHLCRVLRKKPGDKLECLDEKGKRYSCVLSSANPDEARADIITVFNTENQESRTRLTLVFPLVKGGKTEWILQKGTELGVDRFIPFLYSRTVIKPDMANKTERYRRVIHEACKQSEQGSEPVISPFSISVDHLAEQLDSDPHGLRIVCWEREKRVSLKELLRGEPRPPESIVLAVGPEGGISGEEMAAFHQINFLSAGLGKQILRSETACLAAVAAVRYEFT